MINNMTGESKNMDKVLDGAPEAAHPPEHAFGASDDHLLLDARALALRSLQGPIFGPVDWKVPADSHGAVLGEQGSGRSAFLLALAGRMQRVTGTLDVGGLDGLHQARKLRKEVSVARITDFAELEPLLTVAETVDERALLEGFSVRKGRRAFAELEHALDTRFDFYAHIEELPAAERTLLACVLGALRPARYIVVDDIDDSLTADQLAFVYSKLDVLRELGHRYIVSALTTSAVPDHAATVTLEAHPANDHLALQFGHLRPRRITPKES